MHISHIGRQYYETKGQQSFRKKNVDLGFDEILKKEQRKLGENNEIQQGKIQEKTSRE